MPALGTLSLPEVDGSNKGNGNDEVGSGIGNSGGVPIGGVLDRGARINVHGAADLIRTIDALVRGSIIGGDGGSEVNIGNGIRNGGNGYDVGETENSDGVASSSPLLVGYLIEFPSDFSSSPSSSSGSIFGSESVMYPGDSAVGDTAAGSGCSSAGSTSSAGGRYSRYFGPGM
nr:hypothetical protein [Tanacetum cinerariifolium]